MPNVNRTGINPQPNVNGIEKAMGLKVVQTAGYSCSGYGSWCNYKLSFHKELKEHHF